MRENSSLFGLPSGQEGKVDKMMKRDAKYGRKDIGGEGADWKAPSDCLTTDNPQLEARPIRLSM